MKVIIINGKEIDGVTYNRGDTVDLPDPQAKALIDDGTARSHEPPGPTEFKEDDPGEDGDEGAAT